MMKKLIILSAITGFLGVNAQQTHTVAKGDTAYNIARKYGMSLGDFEKMNPTVKDGNIQIGQILSVKGTAQTETKKTKSSGEIGYIVLQPKQTIYGLTKQYRISENQLRALNPDIDQNMKIGNKIALPLDLIEKYGEGQTIALAENTTAQLPTENAEVADGDSYIVQPKDNYYRITRKFKITQNQLFALNPGLEQKGLQAGDIIKINGDIVKQTSTTTPSEKNNNYTKTSVTNDYVTYTVKSGDTVFGILNHFGISLDDLLSLNPELSGGLKTGMVLKIKKLQAQYVKKSGDALNVAIMLPFGFDTNDTKFRAMSSDFLTGAKLAIERNVGRGQKLNINVVDAGNESSFKNSLSQINRDNTDLIIGPFLKSNVLEVLNYVGDKKIPVVAPFANSEDLYNHDNLIIVETNDQVYIDRIVSETKGIFANQKIYIVTDSNKTNANTLKSELEKALKNPNITIVNSATEVQLDQNMMTGQAAPIIAILATKDENTGNAFSNRIIQLTKETQGIKAFSMFYQPSFERKVDELSQANLVYLMDRKINTDGTFEKEILAEYNRKYCKSPSKYAVIGFDVVNDILSRENKSGEIFKQIGRSQTQLATKFEYVRAKKNGAYINTGYRVVRLVP